MALADDVYRRRLLLASTDDVRRRRLSQQCHSIAPEGRLSAVSVCRRRLSLASADSVQRRLSAAFLDSRRRLSTVFIEDAC